ncbi:uncharacterized protein LOC132191767 [Corylus avellana]|uniref:uncharacterized protein LOC132191767 n=1 Tax=Corylus avellana TaxID=13451 RepID=UPI00286C944D|nr:uncharacterized protein LOC132191767 [Corylus avellana]
MAPSPSPIELTVASALLLLSATPPSPSLISAPQLASEDQSLKDGRERQSCRESLVLSDPNAVPLMEESGSVSTPCTSSLASEGSSEEIRARPKSIMDVLSRYHDMKLKVDLISHLTLFNLFGFIVTAYWLNMRKDMLESDFLNYGVFNYCLSVNKQNPKIFQFSQVVRKSRSKILYSSGKATTKTSGSESTEASCLSSSSTAGSSARSRISCYVSRGEKRLAMVHEDEEIRRKHVSSTHMRRRADSILKLLSGGCSSELKIRQLLGDSPDTSKALRMLLKLDEVQRSGTGGRHDPYIYKIA